MSILPTEVKQDALQPNEREVDLDAVWRRVRGWIYAAFGMILVVAVSFAVYFYLKNQQEQTELAAQSMLVEAPNEAALQLVIDRYPSTDAAIQALSDEREGVVFILWGNYAREKGARVDRTKHCVLESAHPSPFSATKFFGNKHFSKANAYLKQHGETPIEW